MDFEIIKQDGANALELLCRGAGKSLAFPIFLFAAQLKEIFLGWVKEVGTTKS
jgi:hypothetical protein